MINIINTLEAIVRKVNTNLDYFIDFSNMGNPGWYFSLNISLLGLRLVDDSTIKQIERSEEDWIHLYIRDNELRFACSEKNMIESFHLMFEYIKEYLEIDFIEYGNNDILKDFQDWYVESCNEDWEEYGGMNLNLKGGKWELRVDYYDLDYNYDNFKSEEEYISESDFYKYDIENNEPACFEDEKVFIGYASVGKLSKLFEGFVKNLSLM